MAMERLKRLERLSTGDLKRFTTVELKGLLETLEWWKSLKESSNESFLPLFFDEHRYLVLKGGGGSGKSIFAGRKVLERVTGEPGHRFLVCRKVGRTIRDSCFAQLRGQLTDYYPNSAYRVYTGDMRIKFQNGSEILFAGLDDVEKLKSIYDITGIWIEEASELLEGDFNQLDIRLRTVTPYYLQIILSFNPISVTHWLKKRFFDFDIKDQEERRRAIERTQTHESTYKDNRFLPAEAVRTLEAFRETDPYYYMVYSLGQWGVTGKTVFDGVAVSRRLERSRYQRAAAQPERAVSAVRAVFMSIPPPSAVPPSPWRPGGPRGPGGCDWPEFWRSGPGPAPPRPGRPRRTLSGPRGPG